MTAPRGRRLAVCMLAALSAAVVLPLQAADAAPIVGSATQVGAWRLSAYTVGQTTIFEHCILYRVQNEGFGLAIGYTAKGVWTMGGEAPDWGLTPNQYYTGTVVVGSAAPFTFTGHAVNARGMAFNVAPEVFAQLKSGQLLTATANQRHYTISLDGIEAATDRLKDCVARYAGATLKTQPTTPPQASGDAPAAAPSALVASIQTLLARLGYDPGPSTGVVGLKTNMAISAFQKSQGERGDGLPSEALRAKLEKALAARGAGAPPPATASAAPPPAAAAEKKAVSTGTGFYIAADTIITNHHVIHECAEIHIRKNGAELGRAKLVADSPSDDLAALNTDTPAKSFLKLRVGAPIKPAEQVLVFGYPLAGALSSAGNTTLGNVTALTGMQDDSRYIQISAAVQPGNSGGPVLDESGRLIAVVRAKLNAMTVAIVTGDIPQNVNFAIKVSTLASFLDAHKVAYQVDASAAPPLASTDRAERAEVASAQLECWR